MSGTIENTNNNLILKFKYIIYLLNVITIYIHNKELYNIFIDEYNKLDNKNNIFFKNNNDIMSITYDNINYKIKDPELIRPFILNNFDKKTLIDDSSTDYKLKNLAEKIIILKNDYNLGSIHILINYYNNKDNKIKLNLLNKFHNFINYENFVSRIDRIVLEIKNYINSVTLEYNIKKILDHIIYLFNNFTVHTLINKVDYNKCECDNKMDIDANISSMICKKCGLLMEITGAIFEDDQLFYQEGKRIKHGSYDPAKHCKFWIERIQACENTDIPTDIIDNIKKLIRLDKIKNKNSITCNMIRKYLRQLNNSKYNEHIPLIHKLITGIMPPQLTDNELQLINIHFDKVINIYDQIKPINKTNCPYHPYFIYKIIEQILKPNIHRIRKIQILSYIHLQSRETLIYNDIVWKNICDKIPEFTYTPTDKNN